MILASQWDRRRPGDTWWRKLHGKALNFTRPYLSELMCSDKIQSSNLTLLHSWNAHPVYSSNVIVQGITIIVPVNSPNTDGINPDSCTNTRIGDCYIVSGNDCIAVKGGGTSTASHSGCQPKFVIRRLTCSSPTSAVIALGSEMDGHEDDEVAFWMTGNYGSRDMVAKHVTMAAGPLERIPGDPSTGICIF
ncbi:hypothetical protein MLD38_010818 [Melastoma candidum]|uniref:Uncharacterized protein n=1 Tax=Melastoma candidum TaxID=119954 RepID=A0ACB9R9E4_9MYRT|nr:hypothetical protein MLD38_010818 [Melastoma candidum]